jgi:hypothetical protein
VLSIERGNNRIRCIVSGTGSASDDDQLLSDATTALNDSTADDKTLVISGLVNVTTNHDFTGAVSLVGEGASAQLDYSSLGSFTWNNAWQPSDETHFDCTTAAGDPRITVTAGTPPAEGDWVVLWSEDQIQGVPPHYGEGRAQCPAELHQVSIVDSGVPHVFGYIVDTMTAGARARGVVVPMLDGVKVDNLILNWADATEPVDFKTALRFVRCNNVTVTDSVRTTAYAPGCFWFRCCANVKCNATIGGLLSRDDQNGVYGFVSDCVNGAKYDVLVKGCRHSHTTTSCMSSDFSRTIDSVSGNVITSAAHGFQDGYNISFGGSLPTGLSADTNYWVSNSTTNTFELLDAPGGSTVVLSSTTAGGTIYRQIRWGTPLNVVFEGIVHVPSNVTTGPAYTGIVAFDTHAEGYGIICKADFHMEGRAVNVACQSRSRNTTFKGCTIHGQPGTYGFRLYGADGRVEGCTVYNSWRPVYITSLEGNNPDRCVVTNSVFDGNNAEAVIAIAGDNHRVERNTFMNCSSSNGTTPFTSKSYVRLAGGTGHRVLCNSMSKDLNDFALDCFTLDETDIEFVGNACPGYGASDAGLGRNRPFTADAGTNVLTTSPSHGFAEDDEVYVTTTGTLPSPLDTMPTQSYYVIYLSSTTLKLEATLGGGEVDITTAGTGTHYIWPVGRYGLDSTYSSANFTD